MSLEPIQIFLVRSASGFQNATKSFWRIPKLINVLAAYIPSKYIHIEIATYVRYNQEK